MLTITREDLESVRDALERSKEFIGATIVMRGYGEEQYSEILNALAKIDAILKEKA